MCLSPWSSLFWCWELRILEWGKKINKKRSLPPSEVVMKIHEQMFDWQPIPTNSEDVKTILKQTTLGTLKPIKIRTSKLLYNPFSFSSILFHPSLFSPSLLMFLVSCHTQETLSTTFNNLCVNPPRRKNNLYTLTKSPSFISSSSASGSAMGSGSSVAPCFGDSFDAEALTGQNCQVASWFLVKSWWVFLPSPFSKKVQSAVVKWDHETTRTGGVF